jgi:hypothetical protein
MTHAAVASPVRRGHAFTSLRSDRAASRNASILVDRPGGAGSAAGTHACATKPRNAARHRLRHSARPAIERTKDRELQHRVVGYRGLYGFERDWQYPCAQLGAVLAEHLREVLAGLSSLMAF